MAIALRNVTTATGTANDVVINCPADVANGDVLILTVARWNSTGAQHWSTPNGWTLLYHQANVYVTTQLYYKVASSEPADYTHTTSSGAYAKCLILAAFSGVDAVAPINKWELGTTAKVTPAVTTTVDNCLILSLPSSGSRSACNYTAPPDGVTSIAAVNSGSADYYATQNALGSFLQASAGDTGAKTWTAGTITRASNGTVALAPATASGQPMLERPRLLHSALLGRLVR